MRVRLEVARQSGDPEALRRAVGQTIDQLAAEASGLRTLISELRPAVLDQLGIEAAIAGLAERAGREGLEVDLVIDLAEDDRPPAELETTIYRIVQEALTNVRKHGNAKRVIVEVLEHDGAVQIRVRDDGDGFDPTAATDGFGLVGMRERAGLFDGTLKVTSAPGEGTAIAVRLPARRRPSSAGVRSS